MNNEYGGAVMGGGSTTVFDAASARARHASRGAPAAGSAPVRALQRQLVDLASQR